MSRRRDAGPVRALAEGVYEHLVTEQLARELGAAAAAAAAVPAYEPLGDDAAPVELARHLGREIERALAALPEASRAAAAAAVAGRLLDHLASLVTGEVAELVRAQRPAPPPRRLVAIHRGRIPDRPATPLPAKVYANEGIAQVLFFQSDETCEVSYADKNGKYQKQQGLTLPKL
jgi:hypothetical protein